MHNPNQTVEPEIIACEICLKEIPKSDGTITEVDDYVMNYFGLECYKQWQEEDRDKNE
ncbi:MAG: DUF3330 domain-containing protein [Gammaproteobacteria bacterium]|nr:DUF3330 domain-containing protein [Gammaproteobacteria bacterium]